jgi:amino acid adenylation domain-containing protein
MSTLLTATATLSSAKKRELLAQALRKKASLQVIVSPLSYGQKALWFLYRSAPESAAYHVSFSARIRSVLDIQALRRSFQALIDRHSSLRVVFKIKNGEPVQEIVGYREVSFEITDCSQDTDEALCEQVQAAYRRPFDLEQGPTFRVNLFTRLADDHVLLVTVHHIVYDAWSLWLNLDEIRLLYTAEVAGLPASPALPEVSYRDHIQRQQDMLDGPGGERLWNFWKNALAGELPPLNLPLDHPRPPVQAYRGSSHRTQLDGELSKQVKLLAQTEGATPFMVLLAAFQALLHRYTGQDDILVGSPTTGRTDVRFNGVVGYFVNPVVLRADLSANPTFEGLLRQVRGTVLRALEHQDFPFPLLVERLQPRRDPSYAPLFQVFFVYQKPQRSGAAIDWLGWSAAAGARSNWGGLEIEFYDLPQQEGQFDLELEVFDTEDSFRCLFKYNSDLFHAATIARLARHFECLLRGIVAAPQKRIAQFPLLDAAERKQILQVWNATTVDYPQAAGVHRLFEQQERLTPDAPALVLGSQTLTYTEMNRRTNQLAHFLRAAGVGPDAVVGVCLERSADMVLALHAVLKAGGAYLPLDPEYPSERLDYMARDAGIALMLTETAITERWPAGDTRVVTLDTEWERIAQQPTDNPDVSLAPDNLAYVIYTSGSTGQPKGVAVPHRGLLNRLQWMQAEYQLNGNDRVLQKTPFSFDVSVWEFFWPLMTGAALIVAPPGDHRDSRRLIQLIRAHSVTTLHFVPSMLRAFLDDPEAISCRTLRRVICSGEALPYDLQQRFFATLDAELVNLYGPTEASIDVSHWTCRRDSDDTVVPIGFPIANTALYILDATLNPVPIGVAGELHIGGVGLARGYLNKPELTADKFIGDPFSQHTGNRLYKTGDLARFRADGAIEYLGRMDHQVKIRGFRIELGEIEAVLGQHPKVHESVVVVREDRGDKRLVTYAVSSDTESPISGSVLREFLMERLPDYMVPASFVVLDALPLNTNGKIDRKALPAPDAKWSDKGEKFVPPRDSVEQALVRHWEAVLETRPIGVRDNFFELGGHSLLAVCLMARIENEFGQNLPIATLFRKPTIEQLGELLRNQGQAPASGTLISIQSSGSSTPFFCVAGGGGSVLYYYPLANYLGPDQPFYGLQAIGLDGEREPLARVEDLAAAYLEEIRKVRPHGPYLLGGHCFGGLVAFEVSQQLRRQGEEVALLVVMDVPARRPEGDLALAGADDTTWLVKLAGVIKESSGKDLGVTYEALQPFDAEARLHYFKERMQAAGFLPPGADVSHVCGLLRVFVANSTARYAPQDVRPVPIVLFRAGESHPDYDFSPADDPGRPIEQSSIGWSAYAQGEVAVHIVPGNHITMMSEPHVARLAERIMKCLIDACAADRAAGNARLS